MKKLRTPDERFVELSGYDFAPNDQAFGDVLSLLRSNGYDVWFLTFHPL